MARIFLDRREPVDLRQLVHWLEADSVGGVASECEPPLDVVETSDAVEVVVDVPGVSLDAIRVVFIRGILVVAGSKQPPTCDAGGAAFHLAERCFGRFARAVRLSGAFDAGRGQATLVSGELRVRLPRIEERRGRELRINVSAE